MPSLGRILPCVTLLIAFSAAPALAAWPTDPAAGLYVAPTAFFQRRPLAIPDGAGGAFVAWEDARASDWDIYVQHLRSDGTIDPAWPSSGKAACTAPGDQTGIRMIADGLGGVLLAWNDLRNGVPNPDVYGQHITALGAIAAGWPGNGIGIGASGKPERDPSICSDGAGGMIATFAYEYGPGDNDIYVTRITSAGAAAYSSAPVYTPTSDSRYAVIAPDGAGGSYIAFQDYAGGSTRIYATHLNSSGGQVYAPTVFYGASVYDQRSPLICIDGLGGAFIAWFDFRSGGGDVYLSRVGPDYAPQQPFPGNAIAVAAKPGNDEYLSGLVYDQAGGAIVTFTYDSNGLVPQAYAQRVRTNATISTGWPVGGLALAPGYSQYAPLAAPDSTGGAVFEWEDYRDSGFGTAAYGTRITATGTPAPRWPSIGTQLCMSNTDNLQQAICSDGRRGAIIVYIDDLGYPYPWQVRAQRIDRYAALGDAAPRLTAVRDVKGDQGGHVRLAWDASYLDADPRFDVGSYWIWRETPVSSALAAVEAGARWVDDASSDAVALTSSSSTRLFRRDESASAIYAWEFVASQPANAFPSYSYVAETTTDSTGASNPATNFMVEAHAASGPASWASAPVSGYSVDNLAPAMPAPFTANYAGGATNLHWPRNSEADLAGYRLYRGSTSGFVPGPGSLLSTPPDTGFADAGAPGAWYKLSAVDIHGNESPFAVVGPGGTTDAGDIPVALELRGMSPNPAREGSILRFSLPRAGRVELAIHDVRGRLVRAYAFASLDAGVHELRWDARDDAGQRLRGGVYFTRLTWAGETREGRFVVAE
jgi:hypothetical protein